VDIRGYTTLSDSRNHVGADVHVRHFRILCGVPLCAPCPLWLRFSQRERTLDRSINQPARDRTVAIDSPIPQERPITARVFEQAQINFANQDFFLIM
jgi:hypothetical protein